MPLPTLSRLWRVLPIALLFAWAAPASAQFSETCTTGVQTSGALYEICTPDGTDANTLVLYAHGFVFPQLPLTIPDDFESGLVTAQGLAYASTSYYANGLVVPELAIDDLTELIDLYAISNGEPERVLLIGFSNGALISTLALERYPETFDGALASCGPVGSYAREVDYLGDIFVAFEYFFPTTLDNLFGIDFGTPGAVNPAWFDALVAAASGAGVSPRDFLAGYLAGVLGDPANALTTGALLGVIAATPEISATFDGPVEGSSAVITSILFTAFASTDAAMVLGGQPFDNATRVYISPFEPDGGAALNAGIARYSADPGARAALIGEFETSGDLADPIIALHTTRDVLVPIWQGTIYDGKVGDPALFDLRPIERFGHCAFAPAEIAGAFGELLIRTEPCDVGFFAVARGPLAVPSDGGRLRYAFGLDNSGNAEPADVDIWATVQDADGDVIYVRSPRSTTVPAGGVYTAGYNQRIPGFVPDGTYTYTIYSGTFDEDDPASSEVCGSETFTVTKGAPGKAAMSRVQASDWADVEIVDETLAPEALALDADAVRVAPNPVRGEATFSFSLTAEADVSLAVYDVQGREVARVAEGRMAPGAHTATLAEGLPSGVYLWRLATGERVETGRLTVVR